MPLDLLQPRLGVRTNQTLPTLSSPKKNFTDTVTLFGFWATRKIKATNRLFILRDKSKRM